MSYLLIALPLHDFVLLAPPYMAQLPDFDRALTTRNICIIGLLVSWIIVAACSVLAYLMLNGAGPVGTGIIGRNPPSTILQAIIALLLNIVVACCTECLGYLHSISLRWALWREGRLAFNSNLRLLNSARSCAPNRWYTNILLAIFLVISYAAPSQILLVKAYEYQDNDFGTSYQFEGSYGYTVNGAAIAALGIGMVGQVVIVTWCLIATYKTIPTWSSSPLNTTLACLYDGLFHREGRCMRPVNSNGLPSGPISPQRIQPSACAAEPSVRYVLSFVWILVPATVAWATTVLLLGLHRNISHPYFSFLENVDDRGIQYFAEVNIFLGMHFPYVYAFLIIAPLQAVFTLSLHCVELLVNLSRDEGVWRRAAGSTVPKPDAGYSSRNLPNAPGTMPRLSSIKAAATSWQTLILFALKPLVHWLFGLGITIFKVEYDYSYEAAMITMHNIPLYTLAAVCLFLALFATLLATRRPRGCQPAAWGHLQTLADLIDDWGVPGREESTILWWGGKGDADENGIRHAGTSERKDHVREVQLSSLYL